VCSVADKKDSSTDTRTLSVITDPVDLSLHNDCTGNSASIIYVIIITIIIIIIIIIIITVTSGVDVTSSRPHCSTSYRICSLLL